MMLSRPSAGAEIAEIVIPSAGAKIEEIDINLLQVGDSPRLGGESGDHIQLLAASGVQLPAILVHRDTMRVIDGMHRLRAAQLCGRESIKVEFFEGSEEEAFIRAVQANIEHGLPLTLADREAAAARIIASNPDWSNRWIATITGLAAGTVAAVRHRADQTDSTVTSRRGRDGRIRPLNSAVGRRIASDALAKNPEASLREIGRLAGISPATVRDVRARMGRGEDPVPRRSNNPRERSEKDEDSPVAESTKHNRTAGTKRDRRMLLQKLRRDPSLRFSEAGRLLLRWIDARAGGPGDWRDILEAVPPHAAYIVAELARKCSDEWLGLAVQLEQQLSGEKWSAPRATVIGRGAAGPGRSQMPCG